MIMLTCQIFDLRIRINIFVCQQEHKSFGTFILIFILKTLDCRKDVSFHIADKRFVIRCLYSGIVQILGRQRLIVRMKVPRNKKHILKIDLVTIVFDDAIKQIIGAVA